MRTSDARTGGPASRRTLVGVAVVCVGLGGAGCDLVLFASRACSAVGCLDGLIVRFDGDLPDRYTVDVVLPDGVTRSATCEWDRIPGGGTLVRQVASQPDVSCMLDGVRFGGVTPEEATLTLSLNDDPPSSRTVTPVIERSYPNGRDCPPECVTATVVLPA